MYVLPWSCLCSAMHLDLCALTYYGCLLVALDVSVLINATIHNCFQPIDRRLDADVQSLFYCRIHATRKEILLLFLQYLI